MDEAGAERLLVELLALEREIVEAEYVRRSDALERVGDAVRRLGEIGSPQGILDRASEELGASSEFERVMISEVRDGALHPRSLWRAVGAAGAAGADGAAGTVGVLEELGRAPVPLEYPSIEHEVVRRQGTELVRARAPRSRAARRLAEVLGWDAYVVAPVVVAGDTIGLLHADALDTGRALDAVDAEVAARYAAGLGGVFERAVLREMLQRHHQELRAAVDWMSVRLGQLALGAAATSAPADGADPVGVEALTARERDVLRLMARGQSNLQIARALVVREGTVKYHVKNILRKLGARSRADAVSRYARAGAG